MMILSVFVQYKNTLAALFNKDHLFIFHWLFRTCVVLLLSKPKGIIASTQTQLKENVHLLTCRLQILNNIILLGGSWSWKKFMVGELEKLAAHFTWELRPFQSGTQRLPSSWFRRGNNSMSMFVAARRWHWQPSEYTKVIPTSSAGEAQLKLIRNTRCRDSSWMALLNMDALTCISRLLSWCIEYSKVLYRRQLGKLSSAYATFLLYSDFFALLSRFFQFLCTGWVVEAVSYQLGHWANRPIANSSSITSHPTHWVHARLQFLRLKPISGPMFALPKYSLP